MSFDEVLMAVREMTKEEINALRQEIEALQPTARHRDVEEEQIQRALAISAKIKSGEMRTRPAIEVMEELKARYSNE